MSIKSKTCSKKDGGPLSTYLSEYEARKGSSNAWFWSGLELYPYKCQKCGYYHLSPKERQTPSEECSYCTDSCGMPKELYLTQEAAEKRAKIIEAEKKVYLRVYECPHQDGWHLTKNIFGMY